MNPTNQQETTAERLAYLLANSSLDETIQKLIINNLESLSEPSITFLLKSLEEEYSLTTALDTTLETFITDQEAFDKKLATKQKTVATKLTNEAIRSMKLDAVRADLGV